MPRSDTTSAVLISSKVLTLLRKIEKKDNRPCNTILEEALQVYLQSKKSGRSCYTFVKKSAWQKASSMLRALLSRLYKKGKQKPKLAECSTPLLTFLFLGSQLAYIYSKWFLKLITCILL